MRPRQPLPRVWLMTDERLGDALWAALARVPAGGGVVFRHYAARDRRALFERVRTVARRRRLVLLLADTPGRAAAWRADGVHGPSSARRAARPLIRSRSCHGRRGLVAARGLDVRFVSPLFATRSHPGAAALGRVRAAAAIRGERGRLIALGGVGAGTSLPPGFGGRAGIDAFLPARDPPGRHPPAQNLKAVPM